MTAETRAALTSVIGFLEAQVPWITTTPDFGLEDFSWQVHRAAGILAHWDPEHERAGTMVRCPTLTEAGECGYRLHYDQPDEKVTCRRCGVTRDVPTLVTVVMSGPHDDIWADVEIAALHYGVSASTVKRMAAKGQIERKRGRYLIGAQEATA